jgi:polysaccharide biosynthesis transport protein
VSEQILPKSDSKPENGAIVAVERRGASRAPLQPAEAEISFLEIWRVLRRRRKFIVASVAVLFAVALLATVIATPKYRSTSTIEFNLENADAVNLQDEHGLPTETDAMIYHVTQETQVRALQSDTLALQVAKELNLQGRKEFTRDSLPDHFRTFADESQLPLDEATHRRFKVLKAFHKNLTVEAAPGSRMIEISFLSPDPQLAPKIVNTLVNDYQDQQFRIRYAATARVADWLTQQLDGLKKQVEASQAKLVQYQKQAGILGTDETHNIIMTRL